MRLLMKSLTLYECKTRPSQSVPWLLSRHGRFRLFWAVVQLPHRRGSGKKDAIYIPRDISFLFKQVATPWSRDSSTCAACGWGLGGRPNMFFPRAT
jgi:hypothetical protein